MLCFLLLQQISQLSMRDSVCGRIKSQKKHLIKQYDTCSSNFAINLLKQKYMRPTLRQQLRQLQNLQYTPPSAMNQTVAKIDIKQSRQVEMSRLQDLNEFRSKVEQTNSQINCKLNYIEQQIALLKHQKLLAMKSKESSPLIQLAGPLKVSKIQRSKVQPQQFQINRYFTIKTLNSEKSICPLVLHSNQTKQFTPQYTLFINKIKDQITLDTDFTNIMLSLTYKDQHAVSQYIIKNYGKAAHEFFVVLPFEQDPLLPEPMRSHTAQIQQISDKLYKFYLKIEEHFKSNLQHCFEENTVCTLFKQIGEVSITLGHLTSYINLRTNCQFRNRNLMKLIRRIGNNTSQIDVTKFTKAFTCKV